MSHCWYLSCHTCPDGSDDRVTWNGYNNARNELLVAWAKRRVLAEVEDWIVHLWRLTNSSSISYVSSVFGWVIRHADHEVYLEDEYGAAPQRLPP